jgi:triacylglycerol esterase/lipase EstA (alpha/beta hydrolase family)
MLTLPKVATLLVALCLLGTTCLVAQGQNSAPLPPKSGTVVLVHGFLRKSGNMSALARSLAKDGWRVENWSYPSRDKTIEEHAGDLVQKLAEIAKEHPNKPISFVTHSMGGLVIRSALNQANCPQEAKMGRAVLIAPPNRGSEFARNIGKYRLVQKVVGDKAGTELTQTPRDGFDQLGDFPQTMPILVISGTAGLNPLITGPNDGKVAVDETRLSTPHSHETSFAGHSWICHAPTVVKRTKLFLASE